MPDPGSYSNHIKPLGADLKNTATMGSKYGWKPKDGPAPGEYEPAEGSTKPRAKSAFIRQDVSPYKRPAEHMPEPGTYSGHIKLLGADLKNTATMGSKYGWKPTEGPAPGQYNANSEAVKPKSRYAYIKEDIVTEHRPVESTPDPGQYGDYKYYMFGNDIKPKIDMGSKYEFKPKEGPGPGEYE